MISHQNFCVQIPEKENPHSNIFNGLPILSLLLKTKNNAAYTFTFTIDVFLKSLLDFNGDFKTSQEVC
jgi:hypothetical protein